MESDTAAEKLAHALRPKEETFKTEVGWKMHLAAYFNDSFTKHEGSAFGVKLVSARMDIPAVEVSQFPSPGAEQINQSVREATLFVRHD